MPVIPLGSLNCLYIRLSCVKGGSGGEAGAAGNSLVPPAAGPAGNCVRGDAEADVSGSPRISGLSQAANEAATCLEFLPGTSYAIARATSTGQGRQTASNGAPSETVPELSQLVDGRKGRPVEVGQDRPREARRSE